MRRRGCLCIGMGDRSAFKQLIAGKEMEVGGALTLGLDWMGAASLLPLLLRLRQIFVYCTVRSTVALPRSSLSQRAEGKYGPETIRT